ncbi:MAG TPA: response regulator transcription factor [Humibacter sp.]|jgi:DNA-binding response OmpR family regulator|nr:response regulator transcription factor [Humibacter sp.]
MARTAVVIEDDVEIRNLVEAVLQQAGFETHSAADGDAGVDAVRRLDPTVTTLDISLPGMDGLHVARRIREFSSTYIVMLTARDEEIDVLLGLEAGADDYIGKPFRPRELRARVEAMLRRPRGTILTVTEDATDAGAPSGWLEYDGLRLNPETRVVQRDGDPVVLTRSEFELLYCLMEAEGRVVGKSVLADAMRFYDAGHGFVSESDSRTVEVHTANLRRKLADDVDSPRWIETVRGVGYRLATTPR